MRTPFSKSGNNPNIDAFSLAPGFSPVFKPQRNENRFNGFEAHEPKPLKPFYAITPKSTGLKPGANKNRLINPWLLAARSIGLVLGLLLLALSGNAQQSTTNNVRLLAVDIYVDSKGKPLAAYQLEFAATNGNPKIVGIEGGEHPAFRDPPHYDPKAMQQERVIIAAFSTMPESQLPSGRVRVATIHVQFAGHGNPQLAANVNVIADARGNTVNAVTDFQLREDK
jgi:hypothetical protein